MKKKKAAARPAKRKAKPAAAPASLARQSVILNLAEVMALATKQEAASYLGVRERQVLALSKLHKFRVEICDPVSHQTTVMIDRAKMMEWVRMGRPKVWPLPEDSEPVEDGSEESRLSLPAEPAVPPAVSAPVSSSVSNGAAKFERVMSEVLAALEKARNPPALPPLQLLAPPPAWPYLTAQQAQEQLNVPASLVLELYHEGALRGIGAGCKGGVRFKREAILEALEGEFKSNKSRARGASE